MKKHVKALVALSIFIFCSTSPADGEASPLCRVPIKGSGLAMDQRDNQRLNCLKHRKKKLSVNQCLKIAASMEYSINAEEARFICATDLVTPPNAKDCFRIAKQMEYPDSGDEVRWFCLLQYGKNTGLGLCNKTAKAMNYPANEERATMFCEENFE